MNRRQLLKSTGAVLGTGLAAILVERLKNGVRYPTIQGEPDLMPERISLLDPHVDVSLAGAYLQSAENRDGRLHLTVRAYTPEPAIRIKGESAADVSVLMRNLSPRAEVRASSGLKVTEDAVGQVNRNLEIRTNAGVAELNWRVPFGQAYKFTVIGDSGAGTEFAWCMERSHALGADFMLHMGDFYYSNHDIASIEEHLDNAPLPMYASIGNHDFQRDGVQLHRYFRQHVGPRNSFFRLGDSMLVNYDTAASLFPASMGDRARLFETVAQHQEGIKHWIFMTHRPFHDPRKNVERDDEHILTPREHGFVINALKSLDPEPTVLCGHIHISDQNVRDGIRTFIAGEGLATGNIVSGRNQARILVGEVAPGYEVQYRWRGLDMPLNAHCHYKAAGTRRMMERMGSRSDYAESCSI